VHRGPTTSKFDHPQVRSLLVKKLSSIQKLWLLHHAQSSDKRRLRSRAKARSKRGGKLLPEERRPLLGELRIVAPAFLSLAQNYDEVWKFLDEISQQIARPIRRAVVDFTPIKRVSPGAVLLLAATLDMWQRLKRVSLRARDVDLWAPEVRRAFIEIGLFNLLRTANPPRNLPATVGPVRMLQLCSGEGSDGSLAVAMARAMTEIAGPIEAQPYLYAGLTEAMTNVAQHAYPKDAFEGVPENYRRWWMTGSYHQRNRSMRILILDLGVGIPATLPSSGLWETIRGLLAPLAGSDDADMIAAAVEAGRTSTGQVGRGNGLYEVRQFVEQSASGRLRILSGEGEVIYEKGHATPIKRRLSFPIGGTLIEWEVLRFHEEER
jgi:hypothetical protein